MLALFGIAAGGIWAGHVIRRGELDQATWQTKLIFRIGVIAVSGAAFSMLEDLIRRVF